MGMEAMCCKLVDADENLDGECCILVNQKAVCKKPKVVSVLMTAFFLLSLLLLFFFSDFSAFARPLFVHLSFAQPSTRCAAASLVVHFPATTTTHPVHARSCRAAWSILALLAARL
jgi:hypothetical protein